MNWGPYAFLHADFLSQTRPDYTVVRPSLSRRKIFVYQMPLCFRNDPVLAVWHPDLEPGPPARLPGFPDGDAGQGENFPHQEQPEPGMFPEPALEDLFLFVTGDTNPVVLPNDNQRISIPVGRHTDFRHLFAVPYRIVKEVCKNF